MIVAVWRAARTLNTVTYGGTSMTRVAQASPSNGDDIVEIWRLLAPTAGTANLVATWSASGYGGSLGIFNTTGQDVGGTPEGTAASNTSTVNGTATGSLAVSGMASGDLVIVGIANGSGAAVTPGSTGGGASTEMFDLTSAGEQSEAFRVPDAVTAVSGSWTGSTGWAIAAIPLKAPAAGFDPTTMPLTQNVFIPTGQQLGQY
jgi:hypothetical protein